MPSPDVLDFERLLAPIPGDKSTGTDLRENAGPNSTYYKVKDGRSAARAAERLMEGGQADAPAPDWKAVVTAATKALTESTKDLEIAAYLIEALCRTHGFSGLRDGFKLTKQLVNQYWDDLYPVPDEEGVATKVAALTGLNGDDAEGTLIAPINRIPITDSASLGRLTYSNYVQATATGRILDAEVREQRIAAGAMHAGLMQKAVAETPAAFFIAAVADIEAALEEFAGLGTALDNAAGHAAPPASAIRSALTNVLDSIKDVARAKLPAPSAAKPEESTSDEPSDSDSGSGETRRARSGTGDGTGEELPTIRNREDALSAIAQLADYFRRSEPHSLIPFALEQAVRWGRMPLQDLFAELIPDDQPRLAMFKQVGIRPVEDA